uniref:Uncharacterized protein n=1 Tax=Geoglobus ahangari TaxID=113653 RepID=A0A7J3THU8_9EURY
MPFYPTLFSTLGFGFLIVVIYVAVEGINHIDGLADFFDSFFASRKQKDKSSERFANRKWRSYRRYNLHHRPLKLFSNHR